MTRPTQTQDMSIDVRQHGDLCILEMTGHLRYPDATTLLRRTSREVIAAGERLLVLNMKNVPFMDSSGIGEIVACFKRLRELGGTLKLVLQKPTYKLFTYTHLERMFEIFQDEAEAVASFETPKAGGPG